MTGLGELPSALDAPSPPRASSVCARLLAGQRQPLAGGNEPGTGSVVPPVAVVLCVSVTCTLAENDVAQPRGDQHVEFEVTQGPKGLQATHVRAG